MKFFFTFLVFLSALALLCDVAALFGFVSLFFLFLTTAPSHPLFRVSSQPLMTHRREILRFGCSTGFTGAKLFDLGEAQLHEFAQTFRSNSGVIPVRPQYPDLVFV